MAHDLIVRMREVNDHSGLDNTDQLKAERITEQIRSLYMDWIALFN
jgi:hypothetical protein